MPSSAGSSTPRCWADPAGGRRRARRRCTRSRCRCGASGHAAEPGVRRGAEGRARRGRKSSRPPTTPCSKNCSARTPPTPWPASSRSCRPGRTRWRSTRSNSTLIDQAPAAAEPSPRCRGAAVAPAVPRPDAGADRPARRSFGRRRQGDADQGAQGGERDFALIARQGSARSSAASRTWCRAKTWREALLGVAQSFGRSPAAAGREAAERGDLTGSAAATRRQGAERTTSARSANCSAAAGPGWKGSSVSAARPPAKAKPLPRRRQRAAALPADHRFAAWVRRRVRSTSRRSSSARRGRRPARHRRQGTSARCRASSERARQHGRDDDRQRRAGERQWRGGGGGAGGAGVLGQIGGWFSSLFGSGGYGTTGGEGPGGSAASASTMTSGGTNPGFLLGGAAYGAAFEGGNVIPFARGGVFERPTLFPMARGIGLMGEAGPEAVLPLRRLPSGRLGVERPPGRQGRRRAHRQRQRRRQRRRPGDRRPLPPDGGAGGAICAAGPAADKRRFG